jgi:hypothetical protein
VEAFFPPRATSTDCASGASTSPSGELCDEVGGFKSAIRARNLRAADLQKESTKPVENRADSATRSFRRIRRRWRLPGGHRSERSEASNETQRAQRAEQSNTWQ